jgi:signal transduction histidine kinase
MAERFEIAGRFETADERRLQPSVLIISDDPEFSRTLMGRWQTERMVPLFTVMSSDLWSGDGSAQCDLAVVGRVRNGRLMPLLKTLDTPARPTLFVADDGAALKSAREQQPRVLTLRAGEDWADTVVLIAREGIRRVEAQRRARKAEQSAQASETEATLGRYMMELRHGLNNALTSVLGNAELLLLEPGTFSAEIRDQIDTIRMMALQMNEIIGRFSSLESEMRITEKDSHAETPMVSHTVRLVR